VDTGSCTSGRGIGLVYSAFPAPKKMPLLKRLRITQLHVLRNLLVLLVPSRHFSRLLLLLVGPSICGFFLRLLVGGFVGRQGNSDAGLSGLDFLPIL
jgi:hypothetical protein